MNQPQLEQANVADVIRRIPSRFAEFLDDFFARDEIHEEVEQEEEEEEKSELVSETEPEPQPKRRRS